MTIWHPIPNTSNPVIFSATLTRYDPPDLELSDGGRRYRIVGDKSVAFWKKDRDSSVLNWMLQHYPDGVLQMKPLSPCGERATFDTLEAITKQHRRLLELHRIVQNGPLVVKETLTVHRNYSETVTTIHRTVNMEPLGEECWDDLPENDYTQGVRVPYLTKIVREFIENPLQVLTLLHPHGHRTEYPLTVASLNYDPAEFLNGLEGLSDDAERVRILTQAWEDFMRVIHEQTGVLPTFPQSGNTQALYALAKGQEAAMFIPTIQKSEPGVHLRLRNVTLPWDHHMHIGPEGDISVTCHRQVISKAMQAYEVAKFKEEMTGVREVDAYISAWIEAHADDEQVDGK